MAICDLEYFLLDSMAPKLLDKTLMTLKDKPQYTCFLFFLESNLVHPKQKTGKHKESMQSLYTKN